MRYHIGKDGTPKACHAKIGNCPMGSNEEHFATITEAQTFADEQHIKQFELNTLTDKKQMALYEEKLKNNEDFSTYEANVRGLWVERKTREALEAGMSSKDLYYNNDYGMWTQERRELHEQLLTKMEEKYKDVPCDGKVIFSSGMPGAGKTTCLTTKMNIDTNKYVTVSSDDFKEMLAAEGAIPEIEGLTPMEASTLVHSESSHLADTFLGRMEDKNKNIIYDSTCKNIQKTKERIGTLLSAGYKEKNIQMVLVDIPVKIAQERAKYRYKSGLNQRGIGGRHLPSDIIADNASKSSKYNSKSTETIVQLAKDDTINLPKPIMFDNSQDAPIEKDFYELMEE